MVTLSHYQKPQIMACSLSHSLHFLSVDSQSEQEGIMQSDLLYLQSRKFHHVTAEFDNLFDKGSFGREFNWT